MPFSRRLVEVQLIEPVPVEITVDTARSGSGDVLRHSARLTRVRTDLIVPT